MTAAVETSLQLLTKLAIELPCDRATALVCKGGIDTCYNMDEPQKIEKSQA